MRIITIKPVRCPQLPPLTAPAPRLAVIEGIAEVQNADAPERVANDLYALAVHMASAGLGRISAHEFIKRHLPEAIASLADELRAMRMAAVKV